MRQKQAQFFRLSAFVGVALTMLILALTVEPATASPEKHALLIGIDDYSPSNFVSLRGAKNDIALINKILVERFEFNPANITVLTDSEASHANIRQSFLDLQNQINPGDHIYIHYSGHGSYVRDIDGDEISGGADSTWVPYGSRPSSPKAASSTTDESINDYDILDDELNGWLAALGEKTANLVFVSDSCHSGTVTRSNKSMATRGAPMDLRPYPTKKTQTKRPPLTGVRIGACRDTEKASEYRAGSTIHGMFTWFWAKALMEITPDSTWHDLQKQTAALIEYEHAGFSAQHPQIEGNLSRQVFGGDFDTPNQTIPVVSVDEDMVLLNAGMLSGVTVGSTYRLRGSPKNSPVVEILSTDPTTSVGMTSGSIEAGDLLVLARHSSPAHPTKVFVRTDLSTDKKIAREIAFAIANMNGYDVVSDEDQCEMIIQILRPRQAKNGEYVRNDPADALPASFPNADVECWILSPNEQLYFHKQNGLKVEMKGDGKNRLNTILNKIGRMEYLISLQSAPGTNSPVNLEVTAWERCTPREMGEKREIGGQLYIRKTSFDSTTSESAQIAAGSMLTFALNNTSSEQYYAYLVNITERGEIIPFYPLSERGMESGLLLPYNSLDTSNELTMGVDMPGREYVRFFISKTPIDIYLLGQRTFSISNNTTFDALTGQNSKRGASKETKQVEWATGIVAFNIISTQ